MDLAAAFELTAPKSVPAAFAAGDYVTAALHGTPEEWEYHAARGLIVDPLAGAQALANFDSADAVFHRAVCAWMGQDEDLACRLLERLDGSHARKLLELIRKPTIDVLSQMPPMRSGPFVLLDGIASDRKFRVCNLGTADGDVHLRPYASVHDFYSASLPPSFYVCSMIEWHEIPIDIGELPCATIGYTSDFDAHILSAEPWLRAMDHMVTCDQVVEWRATRAIAGHPTFAYPMIFAAPPDLPQLKRRERDIDVFMSGTMMSPYQPDKAKLVHQLARVPDIDLLLLDGHIGLPEYLALLSRAKITPSFCRHPGAMLTRSIEALSMGSITLVQRNSPHLLWGGEEEGVFVYDEDVGPGRQIERILANYTQFGEGCFRNAEKIRNAFKAETIASRFFRFCTVLAARPSEPRDPENHRFLTQKRQIFIRGPWVGLEYGIELCEANCNRLESLDALAPAARWANESARELMLLSGQIAYFNHPSARAEGMFQRAVELLDRATVRFPDALIVHFNLARLLLRFGSAVDRERALGLVLEILDRPASNWHVDPTDDILPYDYSGNSINSRDYYDLVVLHLAGRLDARSDLRRIILASLHHVLAVEWRRISRARRAVDLDPTFPFFQLTLAELLLEGADATSLDEARARLVDLTRESMVAYRAFAQLRALDERAGRGQSLEVAALRPLFDHFQRTMSLHEHHTARLNSPFVISARFRRYGARGMITHKRLPIRHGIRQSVIVVGQAGIGCAPIIQALTRQSMPRPEFEFIYVECYDEPSAGALAAADVVLSFNQDFFFEYRHPAFNAGFAQATGEITVIIEPGWNPEPSLLADIEHAFRGDSNGPLQRRVVVGASLESGFPRFVAFMPHDALVLGNFDEHQVFAGALGSPYELAERMSRAGVPWFELGDRLVEKSPIPWRMLAEQAGFGRVIALAGTISNNLLDEHRVAPLMPRAIVRLQAPQPVTTAPSDPPLAVSIPAPRPDTPRGVNRWAYRVFRLVGHAGNAAAERLSESNSLLAGCTAGAAAAFKPLLHRCLPPSAYLRLLHWYRSKTGK